MNESGRVIRAKAYLVVTWAMVGLLLFWAALFSFDGGEKKIAFSAEHGDVYEIDSNILQNIYTAENHQEITFQVFIDDHFTLNFFRVNIKGLGSGDALLSLVGASTANGYSEPVSIHGIKLHEGINDVPIPSDDFSYLTIVIDGTDLPIIKSAELRESIEPEPDRRSWINAALTIVVYLLISYAFVKRSKKKGKA